MYRFVMISIASITLLGAPVYAAVTHRKLDSGEKTIRNVCIMPIETEWSKVGIKGREGMTKEADDWTPKMQQTITELIGKTGAQVVPCPLAPEQLAANETLRQTVLQLQQKYDTVGAQLHKKPKEVKKGRYTLGDEVALLPCAAQADALLFVHAMGNILTGGKKAFGILVGGASASRGDLLISMVDAKSGEVLAFSRVIRVGDKFRNDPEKAYAKPLAKEFANMRIGNASGKKK